MPVRRKRKKKPEYLCAHCGDKADFEIKWCAVGQHHKHTIFMSPVPNVCYRCGDGTNDDWLKKKGLKTIAEYKKDEGIV